LATVHTVSNAKRQVLHAAGALNPHAATVIDPAFVGHPFFDAHDLVQVKYEMLRAHFVDGDTVAVAAATHGYSRGGFYLVADAFSELGMGGLLDERRGRKGPVKLTDEVVAFLQAAPRETSAPALIGEIEAHFGISLHRRTIERARAR